MNRPSRKGNILAGGSGTRLHPMTQAISKQLMQVYDKPVIFYPLSTLMLAGIREILIISTPTDLSRFQDVLSDDSAWGIEPSYGEQLTPDGVPQAFLIGEAFLGGASAALILGDSLFYGNDIMVSMIRAASSDAGATLFAYRVVDPERYGVVDYEVDALRRARITAVIEKPEKPPSAFAVTGLYFFDEWVSEVAKTPGHHRARQTLLNRRDHLLLKQGAILHAIDLHNPGVAATLPLVQDLLDRLEAVFEPQELTYSGSQNGEASAGNRAMVIGAMSDAATGPIPAGGLAKGRPQIGEDPSKQFIMIVLQPLTRRDCQSHESCVCPTYTTTHPS